LNYCFNETKKKGSLALASMLVVTISTWQSFFLRSFKAGNKSTDGNKREI